MAEAQFESDLFLKLLTDALRAGPGSPQWHDAVARLREVNPDEQDEYRLIIQAREHLESGREYRSIRPGPIFTRKVLDAVAQESARRVSIPSANLIAMLATGAILLVIVAVGTMLYRSQDEVPTIEQLGSTYFGTTAVSTVFESDIPAEWRKFGAEPVVRGGLRTATLKEAAGDYRGGGIVSATAIPAGQRFAVEATTRISRATDAVVLQLFVTSSPTFSPGKSMTPHELVAYLVDGQLNVALPDGSIQGQPHKIALNQAVHITIKMDRQFVVVEADNAQIYAGPHHLAERPRWAGLRFLTRGGERAAEDVLVQSVRILKP